MAGRLRERLIGWIGSIQARVHRPARVAQPQGAPAFERWLRQYEAQNRAIERRANYARHV